MTIAEELAKEILKGRYLGRLCKRGHGWYGTGKSLRRDNGNCIECGREQSEEYNKTHQEESKEYKKEYRRTHAEELRVYKRKYRRTHLEEMREYARLWCYTYKAKGNYLGGRKASHIVHTALCNSSLKKQPCEVCGSTKDIQAHHDDYGEPLNVTWLCRKHHAELHKRFREAVKEEVACLDT